MLDERWSSDAEDVGAALRKLLATESSSERIRQAEAQPDGRDRALEAHLHEFGLHESEVEVDILARVAYEIGRALASVPFVESMPALAVLRREHVGYGFDGLTPAALPLVAVARDGGVYVEELRGQPRRAGAGDMLVHHVSTGGGERAGDAADADRMRRLMQLLNAARLVGAGQALLQYGVGYAKEREQFGKQIGAFQAVAHKLADVAIGLEGAELLVRKAAFTAFPTAGGDGAPAPLFASMVHVKAVQAARLAATNVHQVFGGNGFAMEYDVQLYSRRIRSWAMRMGPQGATLAGIGRAVLDPAQRDGLRHLWHYDTGMPLPRWAQEADALNTGA
jgi:hypothetical protein